MALLLVVHDLGGPVPAEAERAFFDGFFIIAPDHWRAVPGATLVGTDVSPAYLLLHLTETARRAGFTPRRLLVTPVGAEVATQGLDAAGEAWLREMLAG